MASCRGTDSSGKHGVPPAALSRSKGGFDGALVPLKTVRNTTIQPEPLPDPVAPWAHLGLLVRIVRAPHYGSVCIRCHIWYIWIYWICQHALNCLVCKTCTNFILTVYLFRLLLFWIAKTISMFQKCQDHEVLDWRHAILLAGFDHDKTRMFVVDDLRWKSYKNYHWYNSDAFGKNGASFFGHHPYSDLW